MRPFGIHQRHIGRCCDHREAFRDEGLASSRGRDLEQADALLFGRVTYEMMRQRFGLPALRGSEADWMEPFADDRRGKEVRGVEHPGPGRLERGAGARDLEKAVHQLKREPGKGLFVGGVKLPLALAELGLIDEYEFVVHPRLAGHGPTCSRTIERAITRERLEFGSGRCAHMSREGSPLRFDFRYLT